MENNKASLLLRNKKALKLLKIAAKHLHQVLKMAEKGKQRLDIIQESRVVQKYLKMANEEILSNHLRTYVKKALNRENKDQQLQEILLVFKRGRR